LCFSASLIKVSQFDILFKTLEIYNNQENKNSSDEVILIWRCLSKKGGIKGLANIVFCH